LKILFNCPGLNPRKYNNMNMVIVIKIIGARTIIHEMTFSPLSHRMLSRVVNIIIIQNLKKAVLKNPLYTSITMCMSEKHRYTNAGEQIFATLPDSLIYYIRI